MHTIPVIDKLSNPVLLAPDPGTRLKEAMQNALLSAATVEVDFSGYRFISSTFLNHAFGRLCIENGMDTNGFEQRVCISGFSEDDLDEVALSVYNAQHRRKLLADGIDPREFYATRIPA